MKAGNISTGQVVILLVVSRCFTILNYAPAFETQHEPSAVLLGNILGFLIQLFAIIPALVLFHRFPNQNIITAAYNRWKPLGWIFAILYCLMCLVQLTGSIIGFQYFMTNAVYPNASILFIVLSMTIACFFCARWGLEGIARASGIIFVFLLASLAFISIASFDKISLLNIHPILNDPVGSVLQAAQESISKNIEVYLLILIFPKLKGSVKKCSYLYLAAGFILLETLDFVLFTILGEFANTQTFPFYTLASIAETNILQRLDSLHMMIWVFTTFARITLLAVIANYCIRMVLPQKAHKFTLPVMLILCSAAAIAISYFMEIFSSVNAQTSIFTLLLTTGFPLLMLCITKRTKKERKTDAKKERFSAASDPE